MSGAATSRSGSVAQGAGRAADTAGVPRGSGRKQLRDAAETGRTCRPKRPLAGGLSRPMAGRHIADARCCRARSEASHDGREPHLLHRTPASVRLSPRRAFGVSIARTPWRMQCWHSTAIKRAAKPHMARQSLGLLREHSPLRAECKRPNPDCAVCKKTSTQQQMTAKPNAVLIN